MKASRHAWLAAAVAVLAAGPAAAANNAANNQGAVEQTTPPPVAQNPQLPPLHLSDDQRAKVRQALSGVNTEVEFQQKSTKPAQSFAPTVGAKIPKGLHPHALPTPLTQQVPTLKRYTYLKFKQQVLIVNPMSRKIVDMFPEASG
jgi:hypothetical protein